MKGRRQWLRSALSASAGLVLAEAASLLPRAARAQSQSRVIEIEARRFRYTPNEIVLRRGEAVTLAFTAIDFVHGFTAPALNVRADLIPGRVTNVAVQPTVAGRFVFQCDNFCGDHHEDMNGVFIVE